VVNDARVAETRARNLAGRGYGDAAIASRLEAAGVGEQAIRDAISALEPEHVRARELVTREPDALKAARLLARRGFDPDLVAELVAPLDVAP
jgi:SOS response regulatory protein OraA/RecX